MTAADAQDVTLTLDDGPHDGILEIPKTPCGLIVFAHGSGSSRLSSRNRHVARILQQAGFATLLFDLLTAEEDRVRANRFDIDLLARRLVEAGTWTTGMPELARLPRGLFGASTGAAAALRAAHTDPEGIRAVVSRGGRPDLAGDALPRVQAPTLLIVGGEDTEVIQLNREAQARMQTTCELRIVPGATHLFEEPGTLDEAAGLARDWFLRWLPDAEHDTRGH